MPESGRCTLEAVAFGYGLPETLVTVSFLKAYGFSVEATPLWTASNCWHWMFAFGGIRICVPSQELHSALELLHSVHGSEAGEEPTPKRSRGGLLGALGAVFIYLFFRVPPPARGLNRVAIVSGSGQTT